MDKTWFKSFVKNGQLTSELNSDHTCVDFISWTRTVGQVFVVCVHGMVSSSGSWSCCGGGSGSWRRDAWWIISLLLAFRIEWRGGLGPGQALFFYALHAIYVSRISGKLSFWKILGSEFWKNQNWVFGFVQKKSLACVNEGCQISSKNACLGMAV